ncbi:response regulator transcription factor [Sphingomonas sp. ASY06-1R]|uniref:response regulator transcription factor n=1 Tax=Sphingomonas sp. ASY06-1R TaxID=3445771 RepID=UPI003FA1A795
MRTGDTPLVLIVDDDTNVRDALGELLASVGIESLAFASPADLIAATLPDRPGCIILDVRMPGGSGLELQRQALDDRRLSKPIIFLTGHGDIPMSVQAMKAGAVDFLVKPARDQTLLDAVTTGIERDRARRKADHIRDALLQRYARLTPREREVMGFVCLGRLNKQIAYAMEISEVTVKLHRGNVMSKMEFGTVGALIRAWEVIQPALIAQDNKAVRQEAAA